MGLIRGRNTPLVLAFYVDLIWHAHQLSLVEYSRCCMDHVGRDIYHDDIIEENVLKIGLQSTQILWNEINSEAYHENIPLHPPIAPPALLNAAQRAL
jgi:hypothetical protein